MKTLANFINEKSQYDTTYHIPPFELSVIKQALEAYKNDAERKQKEGKGYPTTEQLDKVLDFLESEGKM